MTLQTLAPRQSEWMNPLWWRHSVRNVGYHFFSRFSYTLINFTWLYLYRCTHPMVRTDFDSTLGRELKLDLGNGTPSETTADVSSAGPSSPWRGASARNVSLDYPLTRESEPALEERRPDPIETRKSNLTKRELSFFLKVFYWPDQLLVD